MYAESGSPVSDAVYLASGTFEVVNFPAASNCRDPIIDTKELGIVSSGLSFTRNEERSIGLLTTTSPLRVTPELMAICTPVTSELRTSTGVRVVKVRRRTLS